jgi:hypothetical protein
MDEIISNSSLGMSLKSLFPRQTRLLLSCMVSIAHYQEALRNIVSSLPVGGRISVLDFKLMDRFPGQLLNLIFGQICRMTHQDVRREPWVFMKEILDRVEMREWKYAGLLLGNVYLAWGERMGGNRYGVATD